jgi:hypothetical protein
MIFFAAEIAYFGERLLVSPGLRGWSWLYDNSAASCSGSGAVFFGRAPAGFIPPELLLPVHD